MYLFKNVVILPPKFEKSENGEGMERVGLR